MSQFISFIITLLIFSILAILEWFKFSDTPVVFIFSFIPFVTFMFLFIYIISFFNFIQTLFRREWSLFLFSIILITLTNPTMRYLGYLWEASDTKIIKDQEYFISHTSINFIFYFNIWLLNTFYIHLKKNSKNNKLKEQQMNSKLLN
jgi:hypothetical protein